MIAFEYSVEKVVAGEIPPMEPPDCVVFSSADSRNAYAEQYRAEQKALAEARRSDFAAAVRASNPKDAIGSRKVPFSTVSAPVMAEVGLAMLEGACKYRRHNYRVIGVRASVYYDAAMRHLTSWWEGEDVDPASHLSHVTKAISSLVVLRDAMINQKFHDDRPPAVPRGWVEHYNLEAGRIIDEAPAHLAPYTQFDLSAQLAAQEMRDYPESVKTTADVLDAVLAAAAAAAAAAAEPTMMTGASGIGKNGLGCTHVGECDWPKCKCESPTGCECDNCNKQ